MKAYNNPNGKSRWSNFWNDKVGTKFKKIFKKSERQFSKKEITKSLNDGL